MAKRARQTRQHILDVASALFYQRGIRAVGVDTVVSEAGIAKMTLYNHFDSKDALIVAYLDQTSKKNMTDLQSELEKSVGKTPVERILLILDLYEARIHSPEFRGCPFMNGIAEIADKEHPARKIIDAYFQELRSILQELLEEAHMREPKELAYVLCVILSGCLANSVITGDKEQVHHVRSTVQRLLESHL